MIYLSKVHMKKTVKVFTNDKSQLLLTFKGSIEFCLYSLQVGIYLLFYKYFLLYVFD